MGDACSLAWLVDTGVSDSLGFEFLPSAVRTMPGDLLFAFWMDCVWVRVVLGAGSREMQHGHRRLWLPGAYRSAVLALYTWQPCMPCWVVSFEFHPWAYGKCLGV